MERSTRTKKLKRNLETDRWQCRECGHIIDAQPPRGTKCKLCGKGHYRLLRTCICGNTFYPDTYSKIFCSKECSNKYQQKGGKKGKHYEHLQRARIATCPICGKEFRATKDYKDRKQVYCSKECWSHRKPPKSKECPICGKAFKNYEGRQVFCSGKCYTEFKKTLTGNKASNWRGGTTAKMQLLRASNKYKSWRTTILKRDNYTCQYCGANRVVLEIHHIKEVCNYPELMFETDNGIALCHECHAKTDNYGSKAKTNKNQ